MVTTPRLASNNSLPPGPVTALEATRVFGVRGLKHIGKQVGDEYLAILKSWSKAKKIYIEMLDDLLIATMLDGLKLPLLAADFNTEPASGSLTDAEAAQFLWDNMQGMWHQSWRRHVHDTLQSIEWGFAVSEITLEKRIDGRLWLRNIDPRGQDTLYEWVFDPSDIAVTFRQQDPNTGALLDIPLDKCVHITMGGRKGTPEGRPLLRELHRDWRFLRSLEDLEGIGAERDIGGMPVLTLPPEPLETADKTALQAALRSLRIDEELYFMLPNDATLVPYGSGGKSYDIGVIIARKQKHILMRRFIQFLELGMDKVGTQALVEGSQDFFMLGLGAIQQQILEAWNDQLVPFLFRFNMFPGMTDYPRITWDKPGKVDIAAFLAAYKVGVDARLLTPTTEDEEHTRAIMDLPDLPEGEGLMPRDQIEQPMLLPGGMLPLPIGAPLPRGV